MQPRHEGVNGLKGDWAWTQFAANLPGTPIPYNSLSGSKLLLAGPCIAQYVFSNNGGTATFQITLYSGQDATGIPIYQSSVAAGTNAISNLGPKGILCESGVFVATTGGVWNGSVTLVPLWEYEWSPPVQ